MIELYKELKGTILDIGGGGEGVIGQLYGEQNEWFELLHKMQKGLSGIHTN